MTSEGEEFSSGINVISICELAKPISSELTTHIFLSVSSELAAIVLLGISIKSPISM